MHPNQKITQIYLRSQQEKNKIMRVRRKCETEAEQWNFNFRSV